MLGLTGQERDSPDVSSARLVDIERLERCHRQNEVQDQAARSCNGAMVDSADNIGSRLSGSDLWRAASAQLSLASGRVLHGEHSAPDCRLARNLY